MRTYGYLILAAMCLFISADLYAAKPMQSRGVEITPDEQEASYRLENMRINARTGQPVALYRVNYPVQPGTPEAMAAQYLSSNAATLGIAEVSTDLVHRVTKETPGGYHVRYTQHYSGVPVYKSEIVININRKNLVTFVVNDYRPGIDMSSVTPSLPASSALEIAKNHLGVQGIINLEKTETMIYDLKGSSRLVHKVNIIPAENMFGDWEVLVDANTGEIVKAVDNACYANASGQTFDPDPLTRAGAVYGGAFADANDADTDSLLAQIVPRTLLDVTFTGSEYQLDGPYANIEDFESPFNGQFSQPTDQFLFTRSPAAFEAVTVYFHIDQSMRYINETLAYPLMPYQYTGGVKVDPHGLSGADNSHYLTGSGSIAWGEGGVDDSEDEDVILHELGHGLHDWLTVGGLSQVDGLSEGCGDYWANSYNRSTGFWTPSDPQYYWVFQWDGHNEFWGGRVTNYPNHYPDGLVGQIHTDGQIWASTLMQIWEDIGREATDKNFLEALSMTGPSTNQEDAAQAFVQADVDLYAGAHLTEIAFWFQQRGYNITVPTPVITHTPLGDTEDVFGPYLVSADITASAALDVVQLIYGTGGTFTDTVTMTGVGNTYTASIPGTGTNATYQYYIFAADINALASTSPPGAPVNFHEFVSGPDLIPPVITHSPLPDQALIQWPAVVSALVTDNQGVGSVSVSYSINSGAITGSFPLVNTSGDTYEGAFDVDVSLLSAGDLVEYSITATDASAAMNQSTDPVAGFHSFNLIDVLGTILVIDDDATSASANQSPKGTSVRNLEEQPAGLSAGLMTTYLNAMGYLATEEDAALTNPATWGNYDLIISSSGISENTLSNATMRAALVSHSQADGKFIIEGGEVGYQWRNDTPVMDHLLHSTTWSGDNVGPLNLIGGQAGHPIVNSPNALPAQIGITYTAFGSQDAMDAIKAYVLYDPQSDPGFAGISVYDNVQNPNGTQSVYFAFNFAQVTDQNVARDLLENTVRYLLAPVGPPNQPPVVASPMDDVFMVEDDPPLTVADLDTVFSDPDGDTLTYSAGSDNPSVVPAIDGNNMLTLTLAPHWNGTATVWATAMDASAGVTDSIMVTVTPVNDPPSAFALYQPANGDSVDATNPIGFVWQPSVDIEGDSLTYTLSISSAMLDTSFTVDVDTSLVVNGSAYLQVNTQYSWTVTVNDGEFTTASPDTFLFFVIDPVTGIPTSGIPAKVAVHQNHPNPFNPTTTIRYDLPYAASVELKVYNVAGQEVRTLVKEQQTAGYKSASWDGRNNAGASVSSGVYLYRILIRDVSGANGTTQQTKKMILLK